MASRPGGQSGRRSAQSERRGPRTRTRRRGARRSRSRWRSCRPAPRPQRSGDPAPPCAGGAPAPRHISPYLPLSPQVELLHLAARLALAPATPPAERATFLSRAKTVRGPSRSSATDPSHPGARPRFFRGAPQVWAWIFAFDDGAGLLTHGVMTTGAQPAWCCRAGGAAAANNGSACANSRKAHRGPNPGSRSNTALLSSIWRLTRAGGASPRAAQACRACRTTTAS